MQGIREWKVFNREMSKKEYILRGYEMTELISLWFEWFDYINLVKVVFDKPQTWFSSSFEYEKHIKEIGELTDDASFNQDSDTGLIIIEFQEPHGD